MSLWTDYYRIAVPAELIPLGNKAANLFDPNTGGALTFTVPNVPEAEPTHCLIRTQLVDGYQHLLKAPRDPQQWHVLLGQMALDRGREALTLPEIEILCGAILFDDECDPLETQE